MAKVIRFIELGGHVVGGTALRAAPGDYLVSYDPDGHDGRGAHAWSPDLARALRFPDVAAALECWRRVSTVRPVREDGKPNRPLTAITIEIVND